MDDGSSCSQAYHGFRPMPVIAEGHSFSIAVDGDRGSIRVWRRPDLTVEEGARAAQQMALVFSGLLPSVRSLLFDLREAPSVGGPASLDALCDFARACERARIRTAVLVADAAVQHLQVNRIAKECAPQMARVFRSPDEADVWLAAQ
jgi:hypothetical protein